MAFSEKYICIIGAAAIDLMGYSHRSLVYKDSNPGEFVMNLGGVGRNIAENLVRLSIPVELISAVGNDLYGNYIIDHCTSIGISMQHCLVMNDKDTAIHLAICDDNKDLVLGIADMDICDHITPKVLRNKTEIIEKSEWVVLETNLSISLLKWIVATFPNKNYFLDTVSGPKSERVLSILNKISILKLNELEASALSEISIKSNSDLKKIADWFHGQGVKCIIITLGEKGAYYSINEKSNLVSSRDFDILSTIGAGDAFSAGVLLGCMNSASIEQSIYYGMACAEITLNSLYAVSPDLNIEKVKELARSYE